jgi:hypothetical protein
VRQRGMKIVVQGKRTRRRGGEEEEKILMIMWRR